MIPSKRWKLISFWLIFSVVDGRRASNSTARWRVKYLHAVAHAGRDGSGNLEYMGVVTDITERKRADEERQALSCKLEESNARLEEAERVAHLS